MGGFFCFGAKPIAFLDYIAIGKNEPEKVAILASGVAESCVQSGCALIGGETAYVTAETVEFDNKYMRHDIGQQELAAKEV